jgi:hypothetical protein
MKAGGPTFIVTIQAPSAEVPPCRPGREPTVGDSIAWTGTARIAWTGTARIAWTGTARIAWTGTVRIAGQAHCGARLGRLMILSGKGE